MKGIDCTSIIHHTCECQLSNHMLSLSVSFIWSLLSERIILDQTRLLTNLVITLITDLTHLKRGENTHKIKTKIAIRKSTSTFDETGLSRGRICHLLSSSQPKLKCLEDLRFLPRIITKRSFDHDTYTSRNLDIPGILRRCWIKVVNNWELAVNSTDTIV